MRGADIVRENMAEVKPLTIDNMGIGPSSRYAKDQAIRNPNAIPDSRIAGKVEVSVVTPYRSTEFEKYGMAGERASWASFSPPPHGIGNLPRWDDAQTDALAALKGTLPPGAEKQLKVLTECGKRVAQFNEMSNRITGCLGQYTKG